MLFASLGPIDFWNVLSITALNQNACNPIVARFALRFPALLCEAGGMQRKRSVENVMEARLMVSMGASVADVMRKFEISWSAAKLWVGDNEAHKARSARWQQDNTSQVNAAARARRKLMTDADRVSEAAGKRRRYQVKRQERFEQLRGDYGAAAQTHLAWQLRLMALGWSGRAAVVFPSLMAAIAGCSREEFTRHFDGDARLEYVVPLARFDLADPEHLVRANHPSNLQLGHSLACQPSDVMALRWAGNPDTLVLAQSFISRQLANLERRKTPQAEA